MECNSLPVSGWQNVRNFSVRFNAFKYRFRKLSNRSCFTFVKDKVLSSTVRMFSTIGTTIVWLFKYITLMGGSQFLHPINWVVSLRIIL